MRLFKSTFLIILLIQTVVFDACAAINPDKINQKYYWSLSAVGDTIDKIYKPYCPVTLSELLRISDYLKSHPYSSINDVRRQCVNNHLIREGYRKTKDGPCIPNQNAAPAVGICDLFIKELIENQNKIATNFTSVGTYITQTPKGGVYKVQNVVLGADSKSYGKPGKIYLINKDWKRANSLQYNTYTLDMFANITNSNKARGVFNKSYIYLNTDLSKWLYNEYDSWDRGIPVVYALSTASAGLPANTREKWWAQLIPLIPVLKTATPVVMHSGRYDIKRQFLSKYKEQDQTETDAHTNGFLFQNKVVNLEWLGHFLIGMTQEESLVPKSLSTAAINLLQKSDNSDAEEQGAKEADHFVRANQFGREYQQIISHFSKTQTKTKQEAISLVLQYAKSLKRWSKMVCYPSKTKCNKTPGTQDYVICDFDGVEYKMEFDDICNQY
ncbi:MAG: hypothetical protein NC311_00155 [Muribaculaceae bacterium]|nr:hypothetical protein [Muribaculaceae bacterium]